MSAPEDSSNVELTGYTPNESIPTTNNETSAAVDNNKTGEERTPNNHSVDSTVNDTENTATVVLPDNGAAVKFLPDGDAGTADGTLGRNGPTDVPSSSVDAVVTNTKPDKEENAKEEKPKVVGMLQLFRFATKLDVALMVIGGICAAAHGLAMPLLMVFFGDMVDSFIDSGKSPAAPNATAAVTLSPEDLDRLQADAVKRVLDTLESEIQRVAIIFSGIGAAVLVICFIRVESWLQTSYRQTYRIRAALLQAVLRQEIGWFDTHDAGELGSRLSDDVNKIREGIGDKVANCLQWTAAFVSGLIIGIAYGWKLALVIIAVSPLLVICGGFMTYLLTSASSKELAAYAKAGSVAEEVLSAIRTVVAFGGQHKECIRYTKNLSSAKDFGIRKGIYAGVGMGLVFFVIFASYSLAFWYGGKLVREDDYTAGQMLVVFFSIVIGAFSIGSIAPNLQNIGTARGAAYVIWDLVDRKSLIDSCSAEGLEPDGMNGMIEFKNVTFRYPSREDVPILNGLSLRANKGQTVALVGASGCGKSTVVQLIQRFYDPLIGCVEIDGIDIRQLNVKWLRNQIGVVSQEPVLFAKSIAENIRYGRDDVTQEDIERAAADANAQGFISQLPDKYETLVGERGAQLSGGQKQRIAIARALVRDPKILLLDEATSALDTESEATVQAALDKACEGRTTIVVAHRLSTIKNADLIYGLQDGVVHESGTHDELMSADGIYHQLVTNQQTMAEMGEDVLEERRRERSAAGPKRSQSVKSRSSDIQKFSDLPVAETKKKKVPTATLR